MGYALTKKDFYTAEEYFEIDASSEDKYSFFFGEIRAMAGGTLRHNQITQNMLLAFHPQLKNKNCRTFLSDVRLEIIPRKMYVYPDFVMTCNPDDFTKETMIYHPSLIVEVLSASTATFDLNTKMEYYMKIPSLLYYMTVQQKKCSIFLFTKTENGFNVTLHENKDEIIELPLLDLRLSLADVYEKVVFPIEEEGQL